MSFDAQLACLQLLLHFDSSTGAFVDTSPRKRKLARFGANNGADSTAKFGTYSYINTSAANANGLYFGPFPSLRDYVWMVDAWIYPTAYPTGTSAVIMRGGYQFCRPGVVMSPTGKLIVGQTNDSNSVTNITGTTTIPLNTWTHIRAGRDTTGTVRGFINGVQDLSGAAVTMTPFGDGSLSTGSILVGGDASDARFSFVGRIDELAYFVGWPVSESNFTPPSAAWGDPDAAYPTTFAPLRSRYAFLTPSFNARLLPSLGRSTDRYYGGAGRVRGFVKIHDDPDYPVSRRVWLARQRDAIVIREMWSDPITGAYDFAWVDPAQKYVVLSFDHNHIFSAVANDNITVEAM